MHDTLSIKESDDRPIWRKFPRRAPHDAIRIGDH